MKIKLFFAVFMIFTAGNLFAKENLAILPFTGGQGNEGEAVVERFSFNPQLNDAFNLIPRTNITQAVDSEQWFQHGSGLTDSYTAVSIGQQLGARYVISGSISVLGNNKLLVVSIVDIRNLQQLAGDYETYGNERELLRKLPKMANTIIAATNARPSSSLTKLALPPALIEGDADQQVADTLTQVLAINLIRTNMYAIYPRGQSLDQVRNEQNIQLSGATADSQVVGIGYGDNPDFVLSVAARKLGDVNMFNAAIIKILDGSQVSGTSEEYYNIDEGVRAMERLSLSLTGRESEAAKLRLAEEKQREKTRKAEASKQAQQERNAKLKSNLDERASMATRSYVYGGGFLQWQEIPENNNWGGGLMVGLPVTLIKYTSLGILAKAGVFNSVNEKDGQGEKDVGLSFYAQVAPSVGFVFPITENFKIFGDFVVEIGYFGKWRPHWGDGFTPAFDVGIYINDKFLTKQQFEIKYYGSWNKGFSTGDANYEKGNALKDLYTHSIVISWIFASW